MEATFCLRAPAIGVPLKSSHLLPAHNLPAARSSRLRRGVSRVTFSHRLPPLAMKDNGCRKVGTAAGAALVVACAAGALYLSISPSWSPAAPPCAPTRTAGGGGRSAARSSSSIAAAANAAREPSQPANMGGETTITTPWMLNKILLSVELPQMKAPEKLWLMLLHCIFELWQPTAATKPAEEPEGNPWEVLLHHLFFNFVDRSRRCKLIDLLSPSEQLKLFHLLSTCTRLELIDFLYHLFVKYDGSYTGSEGTRRGFPPLEKIEAALALAQLYFYLKNYEKAREVIRKIASNVPETDRRIPTLDVIARMMMAVEKLLAGDRVWDETSEVQMSEVKKLVAEAKSTWNTTEGAASQSSPPIVKDDASQNH